MLENDVTPARKQVGRRTLTRGAAWSVPVVTLAMAAPANAATSGPCKPTPGMLSWSALKAKEGSDQRNKALATTVAGVTVTVSTSGADSEPDNGIYTAGPIGGASGLMLFHAPNHTTNTTQTITLKFSAPVTNVSFSLLDVDSSQTKSKHNTVDHWQDLVAVGPTGFTGAKNSNVTGSGTTGAPYRAINQNSPIPDGGTASNVKLSWTASLDTVTLVYSQDGSQDGSPKVGISDISFTRCV